MSAKREVVGKLKRILEEIGIEYSNILLFGSRARNNFGEESDWDFMIILKGNIGPKEKRGLWYQIYRRFHDHFPLTSIDIILKDEQSFEDEKRVANTLSNEVYLEGIKV
ncbi:MAG: hypothetical protein GQ567_07050 [Methanosarcinales archaeon]|nr:hypothetical protein [Methanosarcinales archaeon]